MHIKWPNDIYYGKSTKIGGVLCQSSYVDGTFRVAVGIGLNVANDDPTVSLNSILRDHSSGHAPRASRERLLAGIFNEFEAIRTTFITDGFSPFVDEYHSMWLHTRQRVDVVIDDAKVPVSIAGLAPSGCLRGIHPETGTAYDLTPDGNSFDFFQGSSRERQMRAIGGADTIVRSMRFFYAIFSAET